MKDFPPSIQSPVWGSRTKRIVSVVAFVLLLIGLWWFSDVLPLLITSAVLAYLLTPAVNFFDRRVLTFGLLRHRSHRGLAVLFVFVLLIALIVVLLLVVIPALIAQLEAFGQSLPRIFSSIESDLERILSEPLTFGGEPILVDGEPVVPLERLAEITGRDLDEIIQIENMDLVGTAQSVLGSVGGLTGPAFSFVGDAFNILINISFLVVMMFYLMKDGVHFVDKLIAVTPDSYKDDVHRLLWELGEVWNAYLRGQIILGLVMGVAVFTAATVLGVPNAPILGLLSALLEFIPNIGPLLALIPAAFLALVSQSSTLPFLEGVPFAIVVIVVWTALQNVEALIIVPRVMGGSLDLHPFIVIVAVIGGASVAGALGIILAAPFVASARVAGQYLYGKMTDQNPFPDRPYQREPDRPGWVLRLLMPSLRWLSARFPWLPSRRKPAAD